MKAMMTYPTQSVRSRFITDVVPPEELQLLNRRGHVMATSKPMPVIEPISPAEDATVHNCYELHDSERRTPFAGIFRAVVSVFATLSLPAIHWRPKRYELGAGLVTNWRAILRYRDIFISSGVVGLMILFSMVAMWALPYSVQPAAPVGSPNRPAFMAGQEDGTQGVLSAAITTGTPIASNRQSSAPTKTGRNVWTAAGAQNGGSSQASAPTVTLINTPTVNQPDTPDTGTVTLPPVIDPPADPTEPADPIIPEIPVIPTDPVIDLPPVTVTIPGVEVNLNL